MIGIVEIYKNFGEPAQELLYTDENIIVDGAGESIVDLFMTPSSIVSSVSGMNDTSNYTVQAISFGKAASAYRQYGHYWAPSANNYYGTCSLIGRIESDGIMRVKELSSVWTEGDDIQLLASSYQAPLRNILLPAPPTPMDTVLEVGTDTAIDVSGGEFHYDELGNLVAGKYEAVGHNLNVLQFDTAASSIFRGCWPVSGTGSSAIIVSSLTYGHLNDDDGHGAAIYPNAQDSAEGASAIIYGGSGIAITSTGYNNAAAMDMSGFVKAYNLCLGELGGIVGGGNVHPGMGSGLLVSAEEGAPGSPVGSPLAVPAFALPAGTNTGLPLRPSTSSVCEVIYVTKIASGDLGFSNLYGGITTLGLWTIDLEKTLAGLSATSHTETDNLIYYANTTEASGSPYRFLPASGWKKYGAWANIGNRLGLMGYGNQRDPYGGDTWQAAAHAGADSSSVAKVTFTSSVDAIDYTFSVYFQRYQNATTNSVGLHMVGEGHGFGEEGSLYHGTKLNGDAWTQTGTLSALPAGSIEDGVLNSWTRVSHTATFPPGTSAIHGHIVLKSNATTPWTGNADFYQSGKYVALSHAKLERSSTATDFVAGQVEYPPFRFKQDNNPLRYKLFAKRTLSDSLTAIYDKSILLPGAQGYQDLTIVWRIKFL